MYKVIGIDQKEYGPVSAEELRRWIAEGRANAQTLAQFEGTTEWKPLINFPEFTSALAATFPFAPPSFAMTTSGYAIQRTNGMAVTGFIFGILSLLCQICCCLPIFPILGLIFSGIGLSQINNDPSQRGRGFAITGIVLSLISLLFFIIFMIFGSLGSLLDASRSSGL
ncbi:MAG: domain containing protein [Pedosphaera sp.]|nr:domain containing protein [Pedosphaera sp.]